MDLYSIENTENELKRSLIDYIETAYLGKNDELRDACKDDIEKQGVLWREPFIEANPAYVSIENGIISSELDTDIKSILTEMSQKGLGVYKSPYFHQIKAVESFYNDKDLFVATGTGSGKTECFMWPMVTKLIKEAKSSSSWNQRGVRAMMLYPMNALVSDQIARLRRMIGTDDFLEVFNSQTNAARRPQFGMYTGRTPYAGESKIKQDKQLAATLYSDLVTRDEIVKEQLIKMGKYPAKNDLEEFVKKLEDGTHYTSPLDAELVTRFEMQNSTPDILITNYSMLEYMLMRQEEQSIWTDTKEWLNSSSENKLLFIIDEAHMYRGASGGEVALLIRRFIYKLGVDRSKIQFILTSASIPQNEDEKVKKFVCDLTALDFSDKDNIEIITGKKETISYDNSIEINPKSLESYSIDSLHGDDKLLAIKEFGEIVGLNTEKCNFSDERKVENWLYDELPRLNPLLKIMDMCRGNATSFDEMALKIFPGCDVDASKKAISSILSIAPLAKNLEGQVLFPSRLHMLFRGIQGIYACSNPNCTETTHNSKMPFGKIYVGSHNETCACGGKIYELTNDRTCGALFIKGYLNENESGIKHVWNGDILNKDELKEIHLYVIPDNTTFAKRTNVKTGWLNSISGRLESNDTHSDEKHYLHVAFSTVCPKEYPNILTFGSCPKCKKIRLHVTDFKTKGNEPFFHLISEQLKLQPPVITDELELEDEPNAGRKVLLFSDSRQRAATLAKELTSVADEEAIRKAIVVAAKELEDWTNLTERDDPSMDLLYVFFLKVALEHKLRFFYGENEKYLREHLEAMRLEINRQKNRESRRGRQGRGLNYSDLKSTLFSTVPELYSRYLLQILCSNFRSLTDLALCWIEPCSESLEDAVLDIFDDNNIPEDLFVPLFSAWVAEILTDSYAYDQTLDYNLRKSITNIPRFGVEQDGEFNKRFKDLLSSNGFDDSIQKVIYSVFMKFTQRGVNDNNSFFLNPSVIKLCVDSEKKWYKCPTCGRIFPYTLLGKCAWCCDGEPFEMAENELHGLDFWREPIIDAIEGKDKSLMTRINTEEHTAQLSHKDQRIDTWSTTEEFELRFQNVHIDDKGPVDVLSCTTTMEVGIDIGSLTAVGLRNVPPMRENYQQRAGRAGRRGSSISTILTYTDNGPHDSYYFNNPQKMISGDPRYPVIDVDNATLMSRHLNVIYVSKYLEQYDTGANEKGAIDFVNDYGNDFLKFVKNAKLTDLEMNALLPESQRSNFEYHKSDFIDSLQNVYNKINDFNEDYIDTNNNQKSILDVFLAEGLFPTYSFPRNVVGFSIENSYGDKVLQEPDRALDMAISEYAPGRLIVVNKKTYKSGGIYNFHSKFLNEDKEHPAKKYFDSKEYNKSLFYCENKDCNWVGYDNPGEICPFCGQSTIKFKFMVKPWGFAPLGGTSIREAQAEAEMSYAEVPSYASPIKDNEMIVSTEFPLLRYARLVDQPLTIMNQGPNGHGFMVCEDCGAAIPGDDLSTLKKIRPPFINPHSKSSRCFHPDDRITNVFLGDQFITDMVLYEISLDPKKINTYRNGYWIDSAAQSLSEAMVLAAGQLLDVEFNDLKGGYRIRNQRDKVFVDIFLFDSLSSGAGYSSLLADRISELIEETYRVLDCKDRCETACHNCLKHYWNQRVQNKLDRNLAIQLLDWCKFERLAEPIKLEEQKRLMQCIKEEAQIDSEFSIEFENDKIIAKKHSETKQIYVYPSMWMPSNSNIPDNSIAVSNKAIINTMPNVYNEIVKIFE